IDGDLDKIAGLSGATFHINAYVIHGRGLSTFNIFNSSISRVGSIEAAVGSALRGLGRTGAFWRMASIRIGQLGADTEFFISDIAALYINGTFGWPDITLPDLPSFGGPNYPLATPGVR